MFLDERLKPGKYVMTMENKLQKIPPDAKILSFSPPKNTSLINKPLQSIIELGKQLLKSSAEGNVSEVKTLLRHGSPFSTDWLGTSPLHLAAQHNKTEVCEVLLSGFISKDARNKVDRTPLHLAAFEGHYQATEVLLLRGADVNCRDMLNMTPLHWAVQNGHTAVVELLVRNGAKTNIKNKFDLTPQDIALQINKLEIAELLQAYEGDTNTATQTLVMQLQNKDNKNEIVEQHERQEDGNSMESIIIVDEDEFRDLDSAIKKTSGFNNEPVVMSFCDSSEEYRQNTKTKDPVIINLAKDINEEMPQVAQKNTLLNNSTPISSFKIVDGVIQPSDEDADGSFSAIQLLQEHGITMLPNDNEDNSILNAVMESGHSVVLTDVGKEVLNTVKQQEALLSTEKPKPKKIISVTPDQFLSISNNQSVLPGTFQVVPMNRRVVMKKNKPAPFGNLIKVQSVSKMKSDLEKMKLELALAKKTIEDYKTKLRKKEIEVQRYKRQLKLLMDVE